MRPGLLIVLSASLLACTAESPYGLRLPDGDADAGRVAFADLGCQSCHRLSDDESPLANDRRHILGGDVPAIETYGKLVASIIHPSHKISPRASSDIRHGDGTSPMAGANLNDTMTVTQLIDLVALLQPMYRVVPPQGNPYAYDPPNAH